MLLSDKEETKMKRYASIIVYTLLVIVLNLILIPVGIFHLLTKIRKGEVSKYTNVRINGKRLGSMEMTKRFGINLEPLVLDSDQGRIMMIHGQPSSLFPFATKEGGFTNEGMAKMIPSGRYHLVSCHNGFHKDFSHNGREIVRDKNTISMYPSISVMVPFIGTMFVYADEFCLKVQTLQNPILWGKYKHVKKSLMENWERKDKEYAYEDLPEEIKKIIDKQRAA
jgi:hypothetical protein